MSQSGLTRPAIDYDMIFPLDPFLIGSLHSLFPWRHFSLWYCKPQTICNTGGITSTRI